MRDRRPPVGHLPEAGVLKRSRHWPALARVPRVPPVHEPFRRGAVDLPQYGDRFRVLPHRHVSARHVKPVPQPLRGLGLGHARG
jgi:hypothetical protein